MGKEIKENFNLIKIKHNKKFDCKSNKTNETENSWILKSFY